MAVNRYKLRRVQNLFGLENLDFINDEPIKSIAIDEIPAIGEKYGFLPHFNQPTCIAVFVTKGGVYKSTLSLNIARMAALHNIRTCVIGLDMQGDVTSLLGHNAELEALPDLEQALSQLNKTRGLYDFIEGSVELDEIILSTDLPSLFYIPETPELISLDQAIGQKLRQEFWLDNKVIKRLKKWFELIVLDCSPNWNRLITNALVGCDILVSPIECRINNYRNLRQFKIFVDEFRNEMQLDFSHLYVPTRFNPARRLSSDILGYYQNSLENCFSMAIRDSVHGEEATALRLSIPEHAPISKSAEEIKQLCTQLWQRSETKPMPLPPHEVFKERDL